MRLFGSLRELVRVAFRVDNQQVSVEPNSATTYTADRVHELPPGDSSQILVSATSTQTFSNKTLDNSTVATIQDSNLTIQDNGDNTKQLKFEASSISTATTRTLTAPDASTTIVGTDATQTLTNKTIVASSNTISGLLHGTQVDNPSSGVHGVTGSVVGTTDTQTLSNKTLGNTNSVTVLDTNLTIQDNSDNTKQAKFEASGISTATTRTYTLPDASTTVVGTDATQTLTNKTFTGDLVSNYMDSSEVSAPATPAANTVRVYAKSDGKMYSKDDAGVETGMFGGGGSSESVSTQTNTDYTILDGDGFTTILVSTGNTTRTITLPAVANNSNRRIRIKKIDSGTGFVTVDGNGSETIDGALTKFLADQYDYIVVQANNPGTAWSVIDIGGTIYSQVRLSVGNGNGSTGTKIRRYANTIQTIGQAITYTDSAQNGSSFTVQQDGVYTIIRNEESGSVSNQFGLSLNANTSLSTNLTSLTAMEWLINSAITANSGGGTGRYSLSYTVTLSAGDVIRSHDNDTFNDGNNFCRFTMTQVAKR